MIVGLRPDGAGLMTRRIVRRTNPGTMASLLFRGSGLVKALGLFCAGFLCSCALPNMAFEGNPMPKGQVRDFLQIVSPASTYDTPPQFRRGYAPFFPEAEAKKRQWGYALADFVIAPDGSTSDIRVIKATAYSFGVEAIYAVQDWRFTPAQKNGQPVPVHVRLPFTFRTKGG